jgi:concentrative nucleoside transporter, CNT family
MMVLYAGFIGDVVPGALGHILTASLINAPGAVLMARLLVPPDPLAQTGIEGGAVELPKTSASAVDAITQGTLDGVQLLINVIAMLIVMVALVSLANAMLGVLPDVAGEPLTLQRMLGWIMAPAAWAIGIPWAEASSAGALLGIKVVLNELLAYIGLAKADAGTFSPKSRLILTYAFCGFANFASLGIMIGGLGTLAPERRAEIAGLGVKSIVAGIFTTLSTAAIVALVV